MVATYTYGADKRRPTGVWTSTGSFSLSNATYEPSGALAGWYWQSSSTNPRIVTRDLLGRPTEILDKYASTTWSDVTYAYDGDGDPTSETDHTSYTWLSHTTTANITRNYGYAPTGGAHKDLLGSWVDDGTTETASFYGDGRRSSDSHGTYNYSGTAAWERLVSRSGGSIGATITYTSDDDGLMQSIAWSGGMTGTTTFGYGPQQETTSVTTSSGTYTSSYDAEMRRVDEVYPTGANTWFRYGDGRLPLEEQLVSGTLRWTLDNVFFGGEPVGQVASLVSPTMGPTAYDLHTDRMGNVRKISTTSGVRVQRIISDAWGSSNNTTGTLCGTGIGDCVEDSTGSPNPLWRWRYPGQYVDAGGVYNEGWRDYVPELGQFTSPDPLLLRTIYEHTGSQSYKYALNGPFRYIDPTGLAIPAGRALKEIEVPSASSGGSESCSEDPMDPDSETCTAEPGDGSGGEGGGGGGGGGGDISAILGGAAALIVDVGNTVASFLGWGQSPTLPAEGESGGPGSVSDPGPGPDPGGDAGGSSAGSGGSPPVAPDPGASVDCQKCYDGYAKCMEDLNKPVFCFFVFLGCKLGCN